MKTEIWNNHNIRFILIKGEWWAVGKDIADVLDYFDHNQTIADHVEDSEKLFLNEETQSRFDVEFSYKKLGQRGGWLINEIGIYSLILNSHQPEAKKFKKWITQLIKQLRESSGLEGFEVFKLTDPKLQSQMMDKLNHGLREATPLDYMKANTIANKAVANMYGLEKRIKKANMSALMLKDRQEVLDATVKLIIAKEELQRHGLVDDISISEAVYERFGYGTALDTLKQA